jgi:hypothetical protein
MRFRSLALAASLATLPVLAEDDFGLLHITNADFEFSSKATLQLHTRIRTYNDTSNFYQFRVGPILIYKIKPRITALSGYYYINQDGLRPPNTESHRIWAGPQFRVLQRGRWAVDTRHLVEGFVVVDRPDFMRYRNRAMVKFKAGKWEPYGSFEALARKGDWFERYALGVQLPRRNRTTFTLAYEYRGEPNGLPGIHLIATTLQFSAWRNGETPHID